MSCPVSIAVILTQIVILLPNNQRQHRTLNIQKVVRPMHCANYVFLAPKQSASPPHLVPTLHPKLDLELGNSGLGRCT